MGTPRYSYTPRLIDVGVVFDIVAGGVTFTTGWTEAMACEICDDLNSTEAGDVSAFVDSSYPEVP